MKMLQKEQLVYWLSSETQDLLNTKLECYALSRELRSFDSLFNSAYLDVTGSYDGIYFERQLLYKEEAVIKTRVDTVVEITAGFLVMLTNEC